MFSGLKREINVFQQIIWYFLRSALSLQRKQLKRYTILKQQIIIFSKDYFRDDCTRLAQSPLSPLSVSSQSSLYLQGYDLGIN